MMAVSHLLAGGAVGQAHKHAWLTLPLAFASHFLLDAVPHVDVHVLFGNPRSALTPIEIIAAAGDVLLGLALLMWLSRGHPRAALLWAGAFLGLLPDILQHLPHLNWLVSAHGPLFWMGLHHRLWQHNVSVSQWPLGFGTQLGMLLGAIYLILRVKKQSA